MDGYKLILNSLLVSMELSTNSPAQNLSFFVGYLADLPWNSWEHMGKSWKIHLFMEVFVAGIGVSWGCSGTEVT